MAYPSCQQTAGAQPCIEVPVTTSPSPTSHLNCLDNVNGVVLLVLVLILVAAVTLILLVGLLLFKKPIEHVIMKRLGAEAKKNEDGKMVLKEDDATFYSTPSSMA